MPYFEGGRGKLFSVKDIAELLKEGPELSKLPASEKRKILSSVTTFSKSLDVEGLENHLGVHHPELSSKLN